MMWQVGFNGGSSLLNNTSRRRELVFSKRDAVVLKQRPLAKYKNCERRIYRSTVCYLLETTQRSNKFASKFLVRERTARGACVAKDVWYRFVLDEVVFALDDLEVFRAEQGELHRRACVATAHLTMAKDSDVRVSCHFSLKATAQAPPSTSRHVRAQLYE
jgi:hypothetical protein